jgi:hypothetical protein
MFILTSKERAILPLEDGVERRSLRRAVGFPVHLLVQWLVGSRPKLSTLP